MKYAVYCANYGALADPHLLLDIAVRSETAGWDGFFVYDHIVVGGRTVDPWTVLAAVAARTNLVLGPMVVAVPRRQPWELAHQTITLDRLSEGRLILGAGIGEAADHAVIPASHNGHPRRERLDAGLELLEALWSGEEVTTTNGPWPLYQLKLRPGPFNGRIPIWVGGRHPADAPMRRAARFDGAFPIRKTWNPLEPLTPDELEEMASVVRAERGNLDHFELVTAGKTPPDRAAAGAIVADYEAVGATWWLETLEPRRGEVHTLLDRVDAGPPSASAV